MKLTPRRDENQNDAPGPVINEMRERLAAIESMLSRFGERAGRSRSRSRSYDRERERDRDRRYRRGYSRSRSPELDRERGRHRDRERDREHGRDWWDRDRERSDRIGESSYARDPRGRDWEQRRVDWDDRGRGRGTSRDARDEPRQLTRQPYSTSPIHHRQEPQDNYGTLVIDKSGRSKWLGPTAGTEWLKNVSFPISLVKLTLQQELSSSTRPRSSSPQPSSPTRCDEGGGLFPFPSWGPPPTMDTLKSHLPPPDVARDLLDCYYENYAWK